MQRSDARPLLAYFAAVLAVVLVVGCADALPRQRPEGELASALKSAEEFAAQAERNAQSAKTERERAEQLYAEMESLKARIEAADVRCSNGLKQVIDTRNRAERVFLQRAAQARQAKKAAATESKPAAAPSATPTPVEPEHSPSDAPPTSSSSGTSSSAAPHAEQHEAAPPAAAAPHGEEAHH